MEKNLSAVAMMASPWALVSAAYTRSETGRLCTGVGGTPGAAGAATFQNATVRSQLPVISTFSVGAQLTVLTGAVCWAARRQSPVSQTQHANGRVVPSAPRRRW